MVLIAYDERSAAAINNLNSTREIKSEVEARCVGLGYCFVEVQKTSGCVCERLASTIATEVELETNWRGSPTVHALSGLIEDEPSLG